MKFKLFPEVIGWDEVVYVQVVPSELALLQLSTAPQVRPVYPPLFVGRTILT